jgi:hypothetical protein
VPKKEFRGIRLISGALAFILYTATAYADQSNIALGKAVTLNGAFPPFEHSCGSTPPQADTTTLTDGVFLPNETCWQLGTIYWSADPSNGNSIDIDLQGAFELNAAIVQVDNNDAYQLQYRDSGGVYYDWWTVPQSCCSGMVTRPNLSDNTKPQPLPTVIATGLRIFGIDNQSDLLYSVSEVQVFCLDCGVPFAALAAQVALSLGPEEHDNAFTISHATFILGDSSNGIALLTDTVTLRIGTVSLTIPPGSFQPTSTGAFAFTGVIDGVTLQVTLTPLTRATFAFEVHGAGATLHGIVVPVPVGLAIGDDSGSTTLPIAEVSAHRPPPQRSDSPQER